MNVIKEFGRFTIHFSIMKKFNKEIRTFSKKISKFVDNFTNILGDAKQIVPKDSLSYALQMGYESYQRIQTIYPSLFHYEKI